jgi:hypothetical protein
MMMRVKLVYKVAVMPTPLMLMTAMLVKLVVMLMEVMVVSTPVPFAVCTVDAMMLILHNQSTVMRVGWANQNSPYPSLWVLLMLKSILIGSWKWKNYGTCMSTQRIGKIKLASSEFDGYALLWWDNFVHSRIEEGYAPIVT